MRRSPPEAGLWADLAPSNITYEIEAPGIRDDGSPNRRYIGCPIHGHHLDADGSVEPGANRYPPRLIVGQPLSWTVEPGQALELAVLTGDPALGPFRFQWRRLQPFDAEGDPLADAVPLADATNRTYEFRATATNLLEQGETGFSPPPEGASAARFYRAILR